MTQDEVFLQAILAAPDDDAPRLVYADWLEERGEHERAEFIRVQCELAHLLPARATDQRREELEARERVLLTQYSQEWVSPLRGIAHGWRFERGFIVEIMVSCPTFLSRAEEMFQLAPLRHLWIVEVGAHLPELAESPHIERLAVVDLKLNRLGPEGARILANSKRLANLRGLFLGGCGIEPAGAWALFASPNLGQLRVLHLTGNNLWECDVPALRAYWHLELTELSLQGTFINVDELVMSPDLARLEVLDLSENHLRFSDVRAEALASCRHFTGLESLNLLHDNIHDAGAEALASSSCLKALKTLNLALNSVGEVGALALARSEQLKGLTSLDLTGNTDMTERARQALRAQFSDRVLV